MAVNNHRRGRRVSLGYRLPRIARPLREACFDTSYGLDVFGWDAEVVEVDFELPFSDVVNQGVFAIASVCAWHDGIPRRRGRLRRGAVVSLPLRCHVVCWDELRVGSKTICGRYPSERRGITIAQEPEVEASFANGSKNKNKKIDASVTAHLYSMSHQQLLHGYL